MSALCCSGCNANPRLIPYGGLAIASRESYCILISNVECFPAEPFIVFGDFMPPLVCRVRMAFRCVKRRAKLR